jgi:Flp pilus assembly protein TadD
VATALVLLTGCGATTGLMTFKRVDVPPLQYEGEVYTVDDALLYETPEVLTLTPEMKAFVAEYTEGVNSERGRLMALHRAVRDEDGLDIRYDPFADGSAQEVFARGTANCLSFAHFFIALAREAGINARYQWIDVRPEWQRLGDRVAVRLHVNVQAETRDNSEFMLDIDPLRRSEVAGARIMTDNEGVALHHNNLAMVALSEERPAEAWLELVQGLKAAPSISQLWVNLGAIYRYTGQDADAERAYFHALDIDQWDRSAMNNLVVLYGQQNRETERNYWEDRLRRYRDKNPYYHASLGDEAMEAGEWKEARDHYERAVDIHPKDGQLIYSLGLAEYQCGDLKAAEKLIEQAVDMASFPLERERYQVALRNIRERQEAAAL